MFRTRLFQLLLLVLAFAFVTEGVVPRKNDALKVRQDNSEISLPVENLPTGDPTTGETNPAETSTQPEQTQETTSTEADPTTSEADPTTSEPPPPTTTPNDSTEETTTAPETTTEQSTTEPPATTTTTEEDPTTSTTSTEEGPASSTSEESQQESTTREPVTSTRIQVITKTNSGGDVELSTSTSVTTSTPDLNEGNGNGSGGGLTPQTRDIVIGVVVGVGGAILLGALGIVAWRIRARKKLAEENDGLMEYNGGYTAVDKTEPSVPGSSPSNAPTTSTRSPFQSTLENYHQPTQPVNASSNF